MKIIDLLNKIANNEEVPKKIKYKGKYCEYDTDCFDYWCDDLYDDFDTYYLFKAIFRDGNNNLNDEIEIIEEKPKKIEYVQHSSNDSQNVKKIKSKIDELVDAVNYLLEKESGK